jgi:hypothetical protein
MDCPTAQPLIEDFTIAAMEYFDAVDKLCNLVGSHYQFASAKRHTEQARVRCKVARLALEQHRTEHRCS